MANEIIKSTGISPQVLPPMSPDTAECVLLQSHGVIANRPISLRSLLQTSPHEFSPTCAVLGGLLAQDVLKALAGRDPPFANFLTFDGAVGSGNVTPLGMA